MEKRIFCERSLRSVILTLLVVAWAADAGAYDRLVVFGDSLIDDGNTASKTFGFSPGGNPYYAGRFSNGPVWTEHLSTALGTTSANYAHGGGQAATGVTTYTQGFFTLSLPNTGYDTGSNAGSQYDLFVADSLPAEDLSDDLFVIGAGAVNYTSQGETTTAPVSVLMQLVKDLYDLGAREFMLSNLPDLGVTPGGLDESAGPSSADLSTYSMSFNAELLLQMDALQGDAAYDEISLYHLDLFSFLNEVIENPIGDITDVTSAAKDVVGAPTNPADPFYDQYLFFDEYHPTAFGHEEIAKYAELALTPVPEPGVMSLVGVGVFLLLGNRRRKK